MRFGPILAVLKCCLLACAVIGCAGEEKSWEEEKTKPDERPDYQKYMESGRDGPTGAGKGGGPAGGHGGGSRGHGGR